MVNARAIGSPRRRMFADETPAEYRLRKMDEAFANLGEVVYFIRTGDLIKIGTTRNLKDRRRKLSVYLTDILAIVPGGRDAERQMLERFAASLAHDQEWFYPTPDLLGYINELRSKAGVPHI